MELTAYCIATQGLEVVDKASPDLDLQTLADFHPPSQSRTLFLCVD